MTGKPVAATSRSADLADLKECSMFVRSTRSFPSSAAILGLAGLMLAVMSCKTPKGASQAKEDGALPSGGATTYDGPAGGLPPAENFQLWSKYCKGGEDVASPVVPNYSDPDVAKAATI